MYRVEIFQQADARGAVSAGSFMRIMVGGSPIDIMKVVHQIQGKAELKGGGILHMAGKT